MKKAARAKEMVRLGWLAHYGHLCLSSNDRDVNRLVWDILDGTAPHLDELPMGDERLHLACVLFASAALSFAVWLGADDVGCPFKVVVRKSKTP